MKLFDIKKIPDPVLYQRADEVPLPLSDELRRTILDMIEYLRCSQDEEFAEEHDIRAGVGLAAPQIGIPERFFAIYFTDGNKKYEYGLVNPKIVSRSIKRAYLAGGEGCLSVPEDVEGYVYRAHKVTIKAYDVVSDKDVTLRLSGYPAIVFQHEYDHLDGVLYFDRIDKTDPFHVDPDAVEL